MATFHPRGLFGWRYPRQQPHCSVELKRRVAERGRRSSGDSLCLYVMRLTRSPRKSSFFAAVIGIIISIIIMGWREHAATHMQRLSRSWIHWNIAFEPFCPPSSVGMSSLYIVLQFFLTKLSSFLNLFHLIQNVRVSEPVRQSPHTCMYQARIQKFAKRGAGTSHTLPSSSLPFSPLPFPFPLLSPAPLPLEVWPLKPSGDLGSAVSSPSGVRGGAQAENDFGVL